MIEQLFNLQTLEWPEAVLRVFLACLFGFFLGFDRSSKNKPIDFRVYMIVAMTACMVALMGAELCAYYRDLYTNESEIMQFDLLRVVEGVLVGIGFLGAGAIIHSDNENRVYGTATGASIWSAGTIGLLIGFGFYGLSTLAFIVLAIILVVFGYLRKPLFNEDDKYE